MMCYDMENNEKLKMPTIIGNIVPTITELQADLFNHQKDDIKNLASSLKEVPFPDCYKKCALAHYLGVGECEYCCPSKFDEKGNPVKR